VASPSFLFSGFPGIYKTDVCTVHTAHTHTVRVYMLDYTVLQCLVFKFDTLKKVDFQI
jgi:hypothetical protein